MNIPLKQSFRILLPIAAFSFFDALIHGGIAAAMRQSGVWNQTVSDMYQLGFAIAMAAILAILYFGLAWKSETAVLIVLLIGFVEDTLYYVFMPLVNPLIALLTHGASYEVYGGSMFPPVIAGWLGWVSRAAGYATVSLPIEAIFLINIAAVCLGVGLLHRNHMRRSA